MSVVKGVAALEHELERAKENLNDVDKTIKKLTGREPGERRLVAGPGQRRASDGMGVGRGRLFNIARRSIEAPGMQGPAAKRRAIGGAFGRLGPRIREDSPEDDEHKPNLQSSVIATPKDTRTRQDKMREEGRNKQGEARNKRMFGILLGTLSKFQAESKVKKDKEDQRHAIEQKLEDRARAEKDEIRKERQNLFNERRKQQTKLKRLEHKMELVQIHEDWEVQTRKLMKFIRTKTKPHIFYMPKIATPATEKKLAETGQILEGIIADRRSQLEEEIEELMNRDDDAIPIPVRRRNISRENDRQEVEMDLSPEKRDRRRRRDRRDRRPSRSSVDKENKHRSRDRRGDEIKVEKVQNKPLGLQAEDDARSDEEREVVVKQEKMEDEGKSKKRKSRSSSKDKESEDSSSSSSSEESENSEDSDQEEDESPEKASPAAKDVAGQDKRVIEKENEEEEKEGTENMEVDSTQPAINSDERQVVETENIEKSGEEKPDEETK